MSCHSSPSAGAPAPHADPLPHSVHSQAGRTGAGPGLACARGYSWRGVRCRPVGSGPGETKLSAFMRSFPVKPRARPLLLSYKIRSGRQRKAHACGGACPSPRRKKRARGALRAPPSRSWAVAVVVGDKPAGSTPPRVVSSGWGGNGVCGECFLWPRARSAAL